jgi:hypothetical protein
MNEMFSKAMAACAAVATFSACSAAIVNAMSTLVDYKVDTVLVKKQLEKEAAESAVYDSSVTGALVKGAKKLITN